MMRTKNGQSFAVWVGLALSLVVSAWSGFAQASGADWSEASQALKSAALPDRQAQTLVTQAKARQIPAAQVVAWAQSMAVVHREGLPTGLMGARIQEGLVKGVPAARIDEALAVLADHLAWAKTVMDQHVARTEMRDHPAELEESLGNLDAGLRAGIGRGELAQIFGKRPLSLAQVVVLSQVAADLRTWGVRSHALVPVLGQAANAGMSGSVLQGLEGKFAGGIAKGRPVPTLFATFSQDVQGFQAEHNGVKSDTQRALRQAVQPGQMQGVTGSPMGMPSGVSNGMGGPGGSMGSTGGRYPGE